ncbi:UV-B-induced protein At3g17800, chloroplastic-like [Tasmannia lanceolata]|uniref:UV-B-induced protein At3g17800, chloroplastic-like n=1 Tax=Tasmannia lanceolata TaxID=3420 RepID=UPI004062BD8E
MESRGCFRTAQPLPGSVKCKGGGGVFSKLGSHKPNNLPLSSQDIFESCGSFHFAGGVKCGKLRVRTLVTNASAKSSKCDFRSVITPLEPWSSAGKFLKSILKNQCHLFNIAVIQQLEELVADRDDAIARQKHSLGSTESCLHRRIAEMKDLECRFALEEVMYMLIVHKFSQLGVPMVPRLSKCISNGRLAIWESKDRELESIHCLEVQEMIKEHLFTILSLRSESDATDNWTTTKIRRLHLGLVYGASIMYGYFLKSASLRHYLELNFTLTQLDLPLGHGISLPSAEFRPYRSENLVMHGDVPDPLFSFYQGLRSCLKNERLRGYIMGFDPQTLQICSKLKSREAINLIENHSWALLYGGETSVIKNDEMVVVTFSSLKRLVLEAVAFGTFLWDVEEYVDSFYKLKENVEPGTEK